MKYEKLSIINYIHIIESLASDESTLLSLTSFDRTDAPLQ